MDPATNKPTCLFVLNQRMRILLADDDPILTEFAKVHLSTPTATVESAPDGLSAWERLCTEAFDLALVDIEMPGLDGFGLVERIRSHPSLRHLPVVMLTGCEGVLSIDRAYQVGATSFVTKPVNWRQLSYQLRYVMRTSRMEAELRAARDYAEGISTLKSNILSVMRHEVRTPLNSVIGFSDIIRKDALAEIPIPVYREYAEYIHAAAHRLHDAFTDMINYAQLSSGELELQEDEYSLVKIMRLAEELFRETSAGSSTVVVVREPEADCRIVCDRDRLVRSLRHLLDNAAIHGGEGTVEFRAVPGRDEIVFSVADRGPGISAERLAASLQPLNPPDRMLTRPHEGLGLGLPIARRIASLHGGGLEIETGSGEGTTVRLTIPRSRPVARSSGSIVPAQREDVSEECS